MEPGRAACHEIPAAPVQPPPRYSRAPRSGAPERVQPRMSRAGAPAFARSMIRLDDAVGRQLPSRCAAPTVFADEQATPLVKRFADHWAFGHCAAIWFSTTLFVTTGRCATGQEA